MEPEMSTETAQYAQSVRHTGDAVAVTRTMGTTREAILIVRALVLAALVTVLIMVGLPAMLGIAAAAH